MARATIITTLGDGRYNISTEVGAVQKAELIAKVNLEKIKIDTEIAKLENDLTELNGKVATATFDVQALTQAYIDFENSKLPQIATIESRIADLQSYYAAIDFDLQNAQLAGAQARTDLNDKVEIANGLIVQRDTSIDGVASAESLVTNTLLLHEQYLKEYSNLDQQFEVYENLYESSKINLNDFSGPDVSISKQNIIDLFGYDDLEAEKVLLSLSNTAIQTNLTKINQVLSLTALNTLISELENDYEDLNKKYIKKLYASNVNLAIYPDLLNNIDFIYKNNNPTKIQQVRTELKYSASKTQNDIVNIYTNQLQFLDAIDDVRQGILVDGPTIDGLIDAIYTDYVDSGNSGSGLNKTQLETAVYDMVYLSENIDLDLNVYISLYNNVIPTIANEIQADLSNGDFYTALRNTIDLKAGNFDEFANSEYYYIKLKEEREVLLKLVDVAYSNYLSAVSNLETAENTLENDETNLEAAQNDVTLAVGVWEDLIKQINDLTNTKTGILSDITILQNSIYTIRSTKINPEWVKEFLRLEKLLATLSEQFGIINTRLKYLKLKSKAILLVLVRLNDLAEYKQQDVWCVDYTPIASGDVATIEIPDEPELRLIAPGARPHENRDGYLISRYFLDPNQLYFNAAILPGIQKHRPQYRRGVIQSVDGNVANVYLPDAFSNTSGTSININKVQNLSSVPIEYLDCDGAVFDVGDNVVIEFIDRDWQKPKVIGFVDNPKPCPIFNIRITYYKDDPVITSPLNIFIKSNNGPFGVTLDPKVGVNTTTTNYSSSLKYGHIKYFDRASNGSWGPIRYWTMVPYLPNIFDREKVYDGNPAALRRILISNQLGGGPTTKVVDVLGNIVGHTILYIGGKYYIYLVERFGVGSLSPGYNAQRVLKSELYSDGGIVSWSVVHEFFFNQLSVTGLQLPNAGDVKAPVNFFENSGISLLIGEYQLDNTALQYTIDMSTGSLSASMIQLAPLTITETSGNLSGSRTVSGYYVMAADYNKFGALKLLKMSISSTFSSISEQETPESFINIVSQTFNVSAGTIDYGFGSMSYPAQQESRINTVDGVSWSSTPTFEPYMEFWDPKNEIFIFTNKGLNGGSNYNTVRAVGAMYYNGAKVYDFSPCTLTQGFPTYDNYTYESINYAPRQQLFVGMDPYGQMGKVEVGLFQDDYFHFVSRPGYTYEERTTTLASDCFQKDYTIAGGVDYYYKDGNGNYIIKNNPPLGRTQIYAAFGGELAVGKIASPRRIGVAFK